MPRMTTHHTSLLLQVVTLAGFLVVEILLRPHCAHGLSANRSTLQQVPARCRGDQAAALVGVKRSFSFDSNDYSSPATTILSSWREGTDCCRWEGVGCDNITGRVTALDLPKRKLYISSLYPSISGLTSLQYLNLASNRFTGLELSVTGFESLTQLTYLNLSYCILLPTGRQVPLNISRFTNLVTLDLSHSDLRLHPSTIVANLSKLKELHLERVNITGTAPEFFKALANHFPLLEILRLNECCLSGPLHPSLSRLHSLSVIDLGDNQLNGTLPDLFTPSNFPLLRVLVLAFNKFERGTFPLGITGLKNLMILDLTQINLIGAIPNSIGNLTSLTELHLSGNSFSGGLPWALSNMTNLIILDCEWSSLSGQIPWLTSLTQLEIVWLEHNNLTGSVPLDGHMYPHLRMVGLSNNSLSRTIPTYLFTQPALQIVCLHSNRLSGAIEGFQNPAATLTSINLKNNQLTGAIPNSFSYITALETLHLDHNNFTGTLDLNPFFRLRILAQITASHNPLLSASGDGNDVDASSSSIFKLDLANCNLTRLPHALRYLPELRHLDLSCNQIQGELPNWIWRNMSSLNLSHNHFTNLFTTMDQPLHYVHIRIIDLSFNMLRGPMTFPLDAVYLDYSNNKFSSILPSSFLRQFEFTYYVNLANNELSGHISYSDCRKDVRLEILDLSGNNLTGLVPAYLLKGCNDLAVLNLRGNHFNGTWPDETDESCQLQLIDLHGNQIQGRLPRSLARCQYLVALDIGGNRFMDSFPLWLGQLPYLRLLVLRYNNFHGPVSIPPLVENTSTAGYFSSAKIIDFAGNGFNGNLAPDFFESFKSMIWNPNHFAKYDDYPMYAGGPKAVYQVAINVAMKQQYIRVAKVLAGMVVIDMSSNRFSGFIPTSIGNLTFLHVVNLSRNSFGGMIPHELGQLTRMESLDLSWNHLTGEIPLELATLTTLEWLNLSYNDLSGRIPSGNQFSTFTSSSFQGRNRGLYGCPLLLKCNLTFVPSPSLSLQPPVREGPPIDDIILWLFIGVGFGVGFALTIVLQVICSGHRKKVALHR